MSDSNPLLSADNQGDSPQEQMFERSLRPSTLDEFVGQPKTREQLEIFIQAARNRGEALDHVLVFGPPGLGKDHAGLYSRRRNGGSASPDLGAGT